MKPYTTKCDAINWLADRLNLTIDEAESVYEDSACPDWDAPGFTDYDFLSDPLFQTVTRSQNDHLPD